MPPPEKSGPGNDQKFAPKTDVRRYPLKVSDLAKKIALPNITLARGTYIIPLALKSAYAHIMMEI